MLWEITKQIEGHTICALGDAAAWPVQEALSSQSSTAGVAVAGFVFQSLKWCMGLLTLLCCSIAGFDPSLPRRNGEPYQACEPSADCCIGVPLKEWATVVT
ncbi:NADH dehydrogenase [ubiquinone] flavoprotein 1, mitochondrial [Haematococcus lacustris]|uniref:NADH dehydrogenase [ubiquinone] flavoprotein 1, mitochondrial n=1 Tax=Haematococcus lacustris TaxID=44745 RepID=A0A699YT77_HAELA|nr:NADH dehydrogenase [ubiquinone] flavoprotein 1, mitochondrial [Haematococcus lacustris]